MDVLVVEDDPRIARVVERALTDVGHRVEVAHDGLEGLTSAERGGHDLLVLDVMLPEMDGIEVARELRRKRIGRFLFDEAAMLADKIDRDRLVVLDDHGAGEFLRRVGFKVENGVFVRRVR